MDLASRFFQQPQFLPDIGYSWHIPPFTLNTPAQRLGCPSPLPPGALPYIVQTFCYPAFLYLWPPGCCTWFFSSLLLLTPSPCPVLDFHRCLSFWLHSPTDKLSPPPHLGGIHILSLPFYFFFFRSQLAGDNFQHEPTGDILCANYNII